jgi:hypothetical protein
MLCECPTDPAQLVCADCRVRLGAKLERLEPAGRDVSPQQAGLHDATVRFQFMVRFYISTACLVVPVIDTLILGRTNESSGDGLYVNLTPFGAFELGVSRRHARIVSNGEKIHVIDLGSTNGTCVNGLRLQPQREYLVRPGDNLQLGSLKMHLAWE